MTPDTGKRIAAARAYAGYSQSGLAKKLGTSQSTIQRIESESRGIRPLERITLLPAIARACGLPESWFYADLSRLDEITSEEARDLAVKLAEDVADSVDRRAPRGT